MNPPDFEKIGADADAVTRNKMERMLDSTMNFFAQENERQESLHEDGKQIIKHDNRTRWQYYLLRWVVCAISIIAPLIILYYVVGGMRGGAFMQFHPAAQALLVSGAFISFIALYTALLYGLFKTPQERSRDDFAEKEMNMKKEGLDTMKKMAEVQKGIGVE